MRKMIFKKPSQFYTIANIDGRTLCLYHNLSELSDHASSKALFHSKLWILDVILFNSVPQN